MKKRVTIILAIVCVLAATMPPANAAQSNTVWGFVYHNPKCDGVEGGITDYPVIMYTGNHYWQTVRTALSGLWAVNDLLPGVLYRFIFVKENGDSEERRIVFPEGEPTSSRLDFNTAQCELYLPAIERGGPSR